MALTEAELAFHALRGYRIGDYVLTRQYGQYAGAKKVRGKIISCSRASAFDGERVWGILVAGMELARNEDEMVPCE